MATTTNRAMRVNWAAAESKVAGKAVAGRAAAAGWEVMKAGWAEVGLTGAKEKVKNS